MKDTATIILNRNLPKITDKLVKSLIKTDGDITDIYVVEAGSKKNNLSKFCTWYVSDLKTKKQGLRYPRGMNYGLYQLWKSKILLNYKAVMLLTNDTEPPLKKFITPLYKEMLSNNQIGLIAPCGIDWGEKEYLKEIKTKFFYFIHNHAYLVNVSFLKKVLNLSSNTYIDFFFDGKNFRGYGTEMEIIGKCYANDYAAAITSKVISSENEKLLKQYYKIIKTEEYSVNQHLYLKEGIKWMHKKYGFSSKWDMIFYVKNFYDKFFEYYPNQKQYQI